MPTHRIPHNSIFVPSPTKIFRLVGLFSVTAIAMLALVLFLSSLSRGSPQIKSDLARASTRAHVQVSAGTENFLNQIVGTTAEPVPLAIAGRANFSVKGTLVSLG